MLIRHAEVAGRGPLDVLVRNGRIVRVDAAIESDAETEVIDAEGAALLPGLHDHHIHLFALAAAECSVACGPPHVRSTGELEEALRAAARATVPGNAATRASAPASAAALATAPASAAATAWPPAGGPGCNEWIRGVGYHESVAGLLDRTMLDRWVVGRPLRIQHRSGVAWFLNGAALERLGLDTGTDAPGVERDAAGRATGRLFRCDELLRERIGQEAAPSLAGVSRRLASFGVTGVTDATAHNGPVEAAAFADAIRRGELLQTLHLMGGEDLPDTMHAGIARAARKILLDEFALPAFDELVAAIERAHAARRPVAIHCVTRAELVLACAALEAAGGSGRDRIEHASVVAPDVMELLAASKATVVTQPGFVYERGDQYLRDVEPESRRWLYRAAGLLAAGIALGGATDAPFGSPDPWLAMRAAVSRTTRDGAVLAAEECVTPEHALALFASRPDAPGGPARRIVAGEAADLCLLDRPWSSARECLSSGLVRATLRAGACVWRRD